MATRAKTTSPIGVAVARRILDYDRAVFGRFERRLRRLPKGEAFADRGTGHGSYFRTLLHILHVRDAWFNFIIRDGGRGEKAFFTRELRYPKDWAGLARFEPLVWEGHEALARGLTEASIGRVVRAYWMKGRYTVGDAVLQVSYEQAHHLGEIIGARWVQDKPSPPMTWIDVNRDAHSRP